MPEPGDMFRVTGRRGQYRCLAVTEHAVEAFGGSTDPGGRRAFHAFSLLSEFRVIQPKVKITT